MRLYETSFLIAPTLPEEEAEKLIEKMAEIVSEKKGKMINVDNWGKRRLAYPIKKFEDAVYVFFLYKGEIDIPLELERNFKQTESVIRYLTIKLEERDNVRRKKKGAAQAVESPPAEKISEEKRGVEEEPVEPAPEEKPEIESTVEETKEEPKTEIKAAPKEEKKEETKEEQEQEEEKKEDQKEEVKAPEKKTEETKDTAPEKKGKNVGTGKEVAPKEEAAVTEEKEK
ncbi:MAG: 30S ribosomal protein S6 [Candidatus Aminicenantes bacterium]|nr:30S ribosomal protein S6 [Candidatus Aminicenantes bacterium]